MSETELAAAQRELKIAFVNAARDFLFGRFFRPFMVLGWLTCVAFTIYGIVATSWDYTVPGIVMAQVYGYFALNGFPKR